MSASAPLPDRPPLRAARRLRMLRAMAWTCAALVLVIIGLSAHIRLTRTGTACEPQFQPQCLSLSSPTPRADAAVGSGEPAPAVRAAHRAAASATLLFVLTMLALTLSAQPALRAERRLILGLLGLTLCLAALGLWGGSSLHPGVTLGNLLGGFALFALCTRLARTATAPVVTTAGATAPVAAARRWVRR